MPWCYYHIKSSGENLYCHITDNIIMIHCHHAFSVSDEHVKTINKYSCDNFMIDRHRNSEKQCVLVFAGAARCLSSKALISLYTNELYNEGWVDTITDKCSHSG